MESRFIRHWNSETIIITAMIVLFIAAPLCKTSAKAVFCWKSWKLSTFFGTVRRLSSLILWKFSSGYDACITHHVVWSKILFFPTGLQKRSNETQIVSTASSTRIPRSWKYSAFGHGTKTIKFGFVVKLLKTY